MPLKNFSGQAISRILSRMAIYLVRSFLKGSLQSTRNRKARGLLTELVFRD